MSPCRASAEKPKCCNEPATSSTSLRMLQNTTHDSTPRCASRPASAVCLRSGSTRTKRCSMTACSCGASTVTSSGSRRVLRAMSRMASVKVAENSRLWRSFGVLPVISRMGSSKPMSNMRSASSSTSVRTLPRCSTFLRSSSWMRPGVPTTTRGSCASSERICGSSGRPPHSVRTLRLGRPTASLRSCCATWSASSRVGHSTSAWVRTVATSSRCSRPRPNAAVLPLPVGACAMTSRPSRMAGRLCAWMGVGCV